VKECSCHQIRNPNDPTKCIDPPGLKSWPANYIIACDGSGESQKCPSYQMASKDKKKCEDPLPNHCQPNEMLLEDTTCRRCGDY